MSATSPTSQDTLRMYHGYAAADKDNSSRYLYVYSEELLPFLTGKIKATEVENEISTLNNSNSPYKGRLKTTNCLKCLYRDSDSNRAFPPSVRAGEQISIYNNGDTDTWYWKSEGRNDELRRTDTLRYGCSGSLDNVSVPCDDNTYFMEVDTRNNQHIKMSTSKANGEKFRYTMNLDAKAGSITIADDAGNQIYIDSGHPRVCMKNTDNSLIDLNGKNIVIACDQDISIMAKNGKMSIYSKGKMEQKTESTLDVTATDNMTVMTDAKFHCRSTSSMTLVTNSNFESIISDTMNTTTGSNMSFRSGGNYDVNFSGSSTCDGNGGVMTMSVGQLNING